MGRDNPRTLPCGGGFLELSCYTNPLATSSGGADCCTPPLNPQSHRFFFPLSLSTALKSSFWGGSENKIKPPWSWHPLPAQLSAWQPGNDEGFRRLLAPLTRSVSPAAAAPFSSVRMLRLRGDPEGCGRGGSRARRSLASRFQLPFCASARRRFKNKQKEKGRAGRAARASSREQGWNVTEGTGGGADLQPGRCPGGVRGGQPCESPHPVHPNPIQDNPPSPVQGNSITFWVCSGVEGTSRRVFPRPRADSGYSLEYLLPSSKPPPKTTFPVKAQSSRAGVTPV